MDPKEILPEQIYTISSKRMFDSCPKKYEFRHRQSLDSLVLAPALALGTEFHQDAEQIYSGEVENLSLSGAGYEKWVQESEEFTAHQVEYPILLPLTALQAFVEDTSESLTGYFGGVVDMIGTNLKDNSIWLVDHKSLSRFYDYPYLYATEQLGMYQVAWKLLGNTPIKGVCISRVKLKEDVHPKHFQAYYLKYLQSTLDIPLGIMALKKLVKGLVQKGKGPDEPLAFKSGVTIALREPRKKGSLALTKLSKYDTAGRLTLSIQHKRGTLIHIERHFYELGEEELKNIVRDFLAYVHQVKATDYFRRAPGLQCSRCPFLAICQDTRRRAPDAPGEVLPQDYGLQVLPPNQEVTRALEKRG